MQHEQENAKLMLGICYIMIKSQSDLDGLNFNHHNH